MPALYNGSNFLRINTNPGASNLVKFNGSDIVIGSSNTGNTGNTGGGPNPSETRFDMANRLISYHTSQTDDTGNFRGFANTQVFDTVVTVTTPSAWRALTETWRNTPNKFLDIICDWDGPLPFTGITSTLRGPVSTILTANNAIFGNYNRPTGGVRIRAAAGRTPGVSAVMTIQGIPKIDFSGFVMSAQANGGNGDNIRAMTITKNSTFPIPPAISVKNCIFGASYLTPGLPYTEGIKCVDGTDTLSCHVENCDFYNTKEICANSSLYKRVWNCHVQEFSGDIIDTLQFTLNNTVRVHVWVEGVTACGYANNAALSGLHTDFNQTGNTLDTHEGYSVLTRYCMWHASGDLNGGSQGLFNDDHHNPKSEFCSYENILCISAYHGMTLWNTDPNRGSIIERNTIFSTNLRKTSTLANINVASTATGATAPDAWMYLKVNNNIMGSITGAQAMITESLNNIFVHCGDTQPVGNGTELTPYRPEQYLTGPFTRNGSGRFTYTVNESGGRAAFKSSLRTALMPIGGYPAGNSGSGVTDPNLWPIR